MRIHIVDKSCAGELLTEGRKTYNRKETGLITYQPGEYTLLIEGCMPYATTDGQMQLEALTDCETFELAEVQLCEPVEYSDAYAPSKYGIIFKEKVVVGEATQVTLHLRLKQAGEEFAQKQLAKLFRLEVFDRDTRVHLVEGYD